MSAWIPVLNKNILALSADDCTKLQPLFNAPNWLDTLKTLSPTQLERLVLVLQLAQTAGRGCSVLLEPQWTAFTAHMNSGAVSSNTLAFWRFQCLVAQGNTALVFDVYQAQKSQLSAPIRCFLDALFLLESKWVSNRLLDHNTPALVGIFKDLAKQMHLLMFDEIDAIERSIFPLQLALRFDLLKAGKQGARLKDGEKPSIHKKVGAHLFFLVPAAVLLNG